MVLIVQAVDNEGMSSEERVDHAVMAMIDDCSIVQKWMSSKLQLRMVRTRTSFLRYLMQ